MFQALANRARIALEATMATVALRAAMAIPFVVAGGFATAAAATRLVDEFGTVNGYSIMAAGFCALGLIVAGIAALAAAPAATADNAEHGAPTSTVESAVESAVSAVGNPADREAVIGLLSTLGPAAIPALGRILIRNWALVALVGAVVFLLFMSTRDEEAAGTAETSAQ